ncbi:FAD-dependent oxidoreductase [candidate division KSB1 bacterium]|nr:FAD-dependent oxidoreductase [candidate division KSB1 bacterium]NIR73481.1 FAD-dependent oxidoreductase [candidate division KSB1 bacterium]NIS25285.1 FAD-dependent oxidoreductase [candidate division KSB1 bacterium]NIT72190.1 FAD-dependent oxidoreductase [candidate division KSB1 bacterium]NIU26007.1 FAD-dependent oxidoreductase [candidate division KSB1 bacterium]
MAFKSVLRDLFFYRRNVPCMEACPVHTDSGKYVQLIADGDFEEAYKVARAPNPFASVCGRVCAAPCEDACRRGKIDKPITIRALKRFVTEKYGPETGNLVTIEEMISGSADNATQRGWTTAQLAHAKDERLAKFKVAVIGAGFAGLACAHDLALLGMQVTVFEASEHAGGMGRYGVPEYRLPRKILENEVGVLYKLGVEIQYNTPLTREFNLQALKAQGFDAIFVGVGAQRGRDLTIEGSQLDGVVKAVDYLLNVNRGYSMDLGERVLVIGGGAVALDAARTALRARALDEEAIEAIEATAAAGGLKTGLDVARSARRAGSVEVHVASLESMAELPAALTVQGHEELEEARKEGIELHTSLGPTRFIGDGHVQEVELAAVIRVFDDDGRFNPQMDRTQLTRIPCDSVVLAIGQAVDVAFISPEDNIELTPQGTIKVDSLTMQTSTPGIFAGGDAAFGPRILIEAISNGKTAAQSIYKYLTKQNQPVRYSLTVSHIQNREYSMPDDYEKCERTPPPTISLDRRTGVNEVEEVFSEEDAVRQAQRCLVCHSDTIYDAEKCILCGRCTDVCPEYCLLLVPISEVDMPEEQLDKATKHMRFEKEDELSVMLKDDEKCIRCGLCAMRCPTGAMTMESIQLNEELAA